MTPPNSFVNVYVCTYRATGATTSIIVPYTDSGPLSGKTGNSQYPYLSSDGNSIGFTTNSSTISYGATLTFGKGPVYGAYAVGIWNYAWSSSNSVTMFSVLQATPTTAKYGNIASVSNVLGGGVGLASFESNVAGIVTGHTPTSSDVFVSNN